VRGAPVDLWVRRRRCRVDQDEWRQSEKCERCDDTSGRPDARRVRSAPVLQCGRVVALRAIAIGHACILQSLLQARHNDPATSVMNLTKRVGALRRASSLPVQHLRARDTSQPVRRCRTQPSLVSRCVRLHGSTTRRSRVRAGARRHERQRPAVRTRERMATARVEGVGPGIGDRQLQLPQRPRMAKWWGSIVKSRRALADLASPPNSSSGASIVVPQDSQMKWAWASEAS
jgi:hypothetical protein